MIESAIVTARGAARWAHGHPWIYRSDVHSRPSLDAGAVSVTERSGRPLGWALWSPRSEISLRLLDRDPSACIDASWWYRRIEESISRRSGLYGAATAFRLIHGEGDALPSLICDRYDEYLVVQLMSAGLEHFRDDIIAALATLVRPTGILARNDVQLRAREGLAVETTLLSGSVPREVVVTEGDIRYLAAPWDGQKTGAFLDQRENRMLIGSLARGRALDCFSYHGSFAIHLAARANQVTALDASGPALERAVQNCSMNDIANVEFVEADAFAYLKAQAQNRERFDTIVLDPPAFAKTRSAVSSALRGYKEINLRAMRLLSPGGLLFTASCSHHVSRTMFNEMLQTAAADSGRRVAVRQHLGQSSDHPEVLTIPETAYLKGALIEALD